MKHGLDYNMQAYGLLFPKHFVVTVDKTFVDKSNDFSIYNETKVVPSITIELSYRFYEDPG